MKKLLIISTLLITGCNQKSKTYDPFLQCNNNQNQTYLKYEKCDLNDAEDYYDVIIDKSDKSNNIILWLEGGPQQSSPSASFRKNIDNRYDTYVAKANNVSFYLINQSQWLKQARFLDGDLTKFTYEDAYKEHLETVDNTHKVIKYLKSKGKKVGLVGGSYGAVLINEYLAKYGDDVPDFVVSIAGRLNIKNKQKMLDAWIESYKKRDHEVVVKGDDEISTAPRSFPNSPVNEGVVVTKIGIANLIKDYTKLIKDSNLNKTTFLSAAPDGKVGWLNKVEITWAESRNASVINFTQYETVGYYQAAFLDDDSKGDERLAKLRNFAHQPGLWSDEMAKIYLINPFNK